MVHESFGPPVVQAKTAMVASNRRRTGREFLTVREVALALRVCTATVYRMCERGQLGHVRVSNAVRIRPDWLEEFLSRFPSGGHSSPS